MVHLQTHLTDSILLAMWRQHFDPNSLQHMALIAVGGYGRGELHPHSDIDIMVLLRDGEGRPLNEKISSFITLLWDLGLDIGHSVRTVEECIVESQQDVTVTTNLMEARLLDGNRVLYQLMCEATGPDRVWPSYDFYQAKMKEQQSRRAKFHDTAYRLEPNIKESPGGLRDIQTIGWISRRHFGTRSLHDLVTADFISEHEYEALIDGQTLLWSIRYMLHEKTNRREDRLLFDHQRDLAHRFGFTDDTRNRSIEQFMQNYYRTVMQMERLNEIILQKFGEVLEEKQHPAEIIAINERFRLRNGYLEVCDNKIFEKHPPALLEVFPVYARSKEIKGVRANTIRLIRSHLHLIDDKFRADPTTQQLFIRIFCDPKKLTRKLRMMTRYGVMAAYLPAFQNIVGRMQYDLFHIYTVDEHTTRVIRNIRRFALPKYRNELQSYSMLMDQVERPELLYIAGLFHDIAKGRDGDHSELGATDAREFCREHGFTAVETNLVQWLVRNHLIMSMTAQRRDLTDPQVIHDFARRVGSKKYLIHLYLLTVADIRGTNPELWNSWKENLLSDLYRATSRVLNRGLDNPIDKVDIVEQKKHNCQLLLSQYGFDEQEISAIWQRMNSQYFLQNRSKEIAWQIRMILTHKSDEPLVRLRRENNRGSTEILVYMRDHEHLFWLITAELDRLGLNILSANINTTTDGYALNTFLVLEENNDIITDISRVERIKKVLTEALSSPEEIKESQPRNTPRRLRNFATEPSITIDNKLSDELTSVYIETTDRPGILSRIGRCFLECDIVVLGARITTLGEKIEDVFFVVGEDGQQLQDESLLQALDECLVQKLTDPESP